ncbi:MAG: DUF192 domain-containing protein [Candidatus Saccharimonadales bacterium]
MNKTQRADVVKTVLAHKRRWLVIIALALIILVLGLLSVRTTPQKTTSLGLGGKNISLLVSKTTQQLETGLGNRASLPTNEGMLFIFNTPAIQCFWMKDMHFPIDIIWLSATKNILYIQPDVSPNTYPESFCPPFLAKYVIELNSGQAKEAGLINGNKLEF